MPSIRKTPGALRGVASVPSRGYGVASVPSCGYGVASVPSCGYGVASVPRRFAFLIPIALSLALSGVLGCSSDDRTDPPRSHDYSQEAGIESIALNRGTLNPPYRDGVRNYNISPFYSDASDLSLTVTLKDARARFTVNGEQAKNAEPFPLGLLPGASTITIAVTSEDGRSGNIVTLTTNQSHAPNTRVYVLDGLGGAPVEGATVTLKDADNKVLEADIPLPADKQGSVLLGLDPKKKYHIYAKGANSAEACFAHFDPSREDTAALYCRPLWGGNHFPAEAPIITDISFATTNSVNADWQSTYDGGVPIINHIEGPGSNVAALRVTAIAKCAIAPVMDGPPPVRVNLDGIASDAMEGTISGSPVEETVLTLHDGEWYFRTTHRFTLPVSNIIYEKDHWLDIVVYDMANNRANQRFYLTIDDSAPTATTDPNISNIRPRLYMAQAQTFGISRNIPGINPVDIDAQGINPIDDYGVSYQTLLEFRTSANAAGPQAQFYLIRGYEVERSVGDANHWEKIETVHFAAPTRGQGGSEDGSTYTYFFRYVDSSPDVVEDDMYYRFRAFNGNPNGNGFSQYSNVLRAKPLPPFTTKLLEPANNAVVSKIWPRFKFKVTNPELFNREVADAFMTTLYLKDVYANYEVYMGTFWVQYYDSTGALIYPDGRPLIAFYDNYEYWDDQDWYIAEYDSGEKDEDDKPIYIPFAWFEQDGTFIIDTDNDLFKTLIAYNPIDDRHFSLLPGGAYEWSMFGYLGGVVWQNMAPALDNMAFFYKDLPVPQDAPGDTRLTSWSFGSGLANGLGSPNGFFTLIVDPEAK